MKIYIGKTKTYSDFNHNWGLLMPQQFNSQTQMIILQNKKNLSGINIDTIPGLVMSLNKTIIIHKKP